MRKILQYVILLTLVFGGVARAEIKIEHWKHVSGANVYWVNASSIPMLDVQVDWTAGSIFDPVNKLGLASMTSVMIDKGSQSLKEQDISEKLADLGALMDFSAGSERASLKIRTLSDPLKRDAVIALAAQVIKAPSFDEKILRREKERTISFIREASVKPDVILSQAFDQRIYGVHPLARFPKESTIRAITRQDLLEFYRQSYVASEATVTVVGDIAKEDVNRLVDRLMSVLPEKSARNTVVPMVRRLERLPLEQRRIRIPHSSQQAHITMGLPAIDRKDPDYFPLLVGNYVLGGGGFVSRLMKEVREKRGLSYSVYSYVAAGKQIGPFAAGLQTQKKQADMALEVMRQTIADYVNNGPTAEELDAAKQNLINGFPLRIDSNKKILDNVANIAWVGLPLDTLDTWTDQVRQVTVEQVKQAFSKYIDMQAMVTVIVGGDER